MSQEQIYDENIYDKFGEPVSGTLAIKDHNGLMHNIVLPNTGPDYEYVAGQFERLGLEFAYDRSDEPKPTAEDYVADDPESEAVTNIAAYDYSFNGGTSYTFVPTVAHSCKEGEVFVYSDTLLTNTALPCTLQIGHHLKYLSASGGGYYYATGGTTTLEITEAGTYPIEVIKTGTAIFGETPKWAGYTADIVVEVNPNSNNNSTTFTVTAKNFTFYTRSAAIKYKDWKERPLSTTLRLVQNYNTKKTADLTYLTDYIKSLENRIAALEART